MQFGNGYAGCAVDLCERRDTVHGTTDGRLVAGLVQWGNAGYLGDAIPGSGGAEETTTPFFDQRDGAGQLLASRVPIEVRDCHDERKPPVAIVIQAGYRPVLELALRGRWVTVAIAASIAMASAWGSPSCVA